MDSENLLILAGVAAAIYYFGPTLQNLGSATKTISGDVNGTVNAIQTLFNTGNPQSLSQSPTAPNTNLNPTAQFFQQLGLFPLAGAAVVGQQIYQAAGSPQW